MAEKTKIKVRFAPSPTGNIHIGNARTALFNWIFAKSNGGQFILRYDDTDTVRSRQEFADGIARDIGWLGLEPDQIERQSLRVPEYDMAVQQLIKEGKLYPCYETPDELDRRRKRLLARGRPPIYDRAALNLSEQDCSDLEKSGRRAHWRFLLPNFESDPFLPKRTNVSWDDVFRGPQSVDLASMSDPVLIRANGSYLYTLPSVVDDIDMKVTHVIRGDDHVTNTGAQIALFKALGSDAPDFGHHNLLTGAAGEGLSKRLGSLSIASLREDGYEPMAVSSLAVLIGTSIAVSACKSIDELVDVFDPGAVTKSPAKFDIRELAGLSARLLHDMNYTEARSTLVELNADGGEEFWDVVKSNISRFNEAADWWRIVDTCPDENVEFQPDPIFLEDALSVLPVAPFDQETWKNWTTAVKEKTGRKGRDLFMPLRIALTGRDHGPELAKLLPLIGSEKTILRLS